MQSPDPMQVELAHVYAKLQQLENDQKEIGRGLHEVQIELARGRRFPVAMYGVLAALIVTVLGAAFMLHTELKMNTAAVADIPELRERLTSAFNGMRAAELVRAEILAEQNRIRTMTDKLSVDCCQAYPVLVEKLKNLEGRVVGHGSEDWHRSDHNLYAQMMDARLAMFDARIKMIEDRRK